MSITTVLSTVGSFLSGPIMTGIANVATLGNLGVSIATKVDTTDIKTTVGSIRSDINTLDSDILSLTADIGDMRKEGYWSTALLGGTPIAVTNGVPKPVQVQTQAQTASTVAPVQPTAQITPVTIAPAPVAATPTADPTPAPAAAAPVQTVTVAPPQADLATFLAALPEIVSQAVKTAIATPVQTQTDPTPAPAAAAQDTPPTSA